MARRGSKDLEALLKSLEAEGYFVGLNNSGHYYAEADDESRVVIGNTPSDHRTLQNACALLRRQGFEFTFRGKRYVRKQKDQEQP